MPVIPSEYVGYRGDSLNHTNTVFVLSIQMNKIEVPVCHFKSTAFHQRHMKLYTYGRNLHMHFRSVCLFGLIAESAEVILTGVSLEDSY